MDPVYLPLVFDTTSDPPHYILHVTPQNNSLVGWLVVTHYGLFGTTILAVTVLAILTRKVHLESFKDTKEVNAFVFSTVLCLCTWLPYLDVFTFVKHVAIASYIISVYPYFVIPLLCKVFLFVPKLWSARHEKRRKSTKKSGKEIPGEHTHLVQEHTETHSQWT